MWNTSDIAVIIQILTFSHQLATISLAIGLINEETESTLIDFNTLNAFK